ncbi:MAG TPA: YiiD C-terminal domain-containing protein, partial [Chlamydiales bacterium]|nr:YiiD C-terminal domain-containing protein [Chlamydiales bacterium]
QKIPLSKARTFGTLESMEHKLQSYLHTHIPITKAVGVEVVEASQAKVILSAPFAPNINHKKTVFGGSLHAVATLSCWSLMYIALQEVGISDVQIVITESHVNYLAPVDSDFLAECKAPEKEAWDRFIHMLQAKGKARLKLSAKIFHKDHLAVDFQATFAAIRP